MLNLNGMNSANGANANEHINDTTKKETIEMTNTIPMTNEAAQAAKYNEIIKNLKTPDSLKVVKGGNVLVLTVVHDDFAGQFGAVDTSAQFLNNAPMTIDESRVWAFTLAEVKNPNAKLPGYVKRNHRSAVTQLDAISWYLSDLADKFPAETNLSLTVGEQSSAFVWIVKGAVEEGKTLDEFKALWATKYLKKVNSDFYSAGERTIPVEVDEAAARLFVAMKRWHDTHADAQVNIDTAQKLKFGDVEFVSLTGGDKEASPIWQKYAKIMADAKKKTVEFYPGDDGVWAKAVRLDDVNYDPAVASVAAKVRQQVKAKGGDDRYCRLIFLENSDGAKDFIGYTMDTALLPLNMELSFRIVGHQNKEGVCVMSKFKVHKTIWASDDEGKTWQYIDTCDIVDEIFDAKPGEKVAFKVNNRDVSTYDRLVLWAVTMRASRKQAATVGTITFQA